MDAGAFWFMIQVRRWQIPMPIYVSAAIVGGFVIALILTRLVFHVGVPEGRLGLWLAACAVAGVAAGIVIYQTILSFGSCWAWFGCY